jgi:aspartyl-tRNA(Asn)/glutamyl-tRNA(Gln) amidotransferase subunit C
VLLLALHEEIVEPDLENINVSEPAPGTFREAGRMRDKDTIRKVARLAGLGLHEEELARFASDFQRILDFFEELNEPDTSQVEPAIHALDLEGSLAEDRTRESNSRKQFLTNAPHARDGFYQVPRVIE